MFRTMISPIVRGPKLRVIACGIMQPRCCRPVACKRRLPGSRPTTSWLHYTTSCNTQSSVPEDGRNHRPKYVELIGIINKPLLLHLVDCLYYYFRCNFLLSPLFLYHFYQRTFLNNLVYSDMYFGVKK